MEGDEVLKELITAPAEDLPSLCREHYRLCSDPRFWRARFREEGLPPVKALETQGLRPPGYWGRLYEKTREAAKKVSRDLALYPNLLVSFSGGEGDESLLVPGASRSLLDDYSLLAARYRREADELRDRMARAPPGKRNRLYGSLMVVLAGVPHLRIERRGKTAYYILGGERLTLDPTSLKDLLFRAYFGGLDVFPAPG